MRDVPQSELYPVLELSYADSLELFTWCVFRRNNLEVVDASFHNFVEKITRACGGLPLALEVMGGYLAQKRNLADDEKYWNEAISRLRTINEIIGKLRMSYDSLDDKDSQCMFLDIACFMLGHPEEVALEVWKANEQYAAPSWSLDQLVQRCLVKVDSDGQLSMHDLLRDMGRNIVKENASHKPEKLSHVWDPKTAAKLLQKKQGLNEALIALSISGVDPRVACTAQAYSRLIGLKYLSLDGYSVKGDFSEWPQEMTWLQWRYFPGKELPSSLKQLNLVVLDLGYSRNLCHVWPRDNETQVATPPNPKTILSNINEFVNLKFLYLNRCLSLESLPDSFSELSNLETLDLSRSEKLWKLPPSVCGLKQLKVWKMSYTALVHLPQDFGQLQSLTSIDFKGCRSLEDLPDSFSELSNLEILNLHGCKKLQKLPPSICGLKQLRVWMMSNTAVVHLPQDFGQFQSLTSIDFEDCGSLEDLPDSFSEFSNLEILNLYGCKKLQKLPPSICGLKQLRVWMMSNTAVVHLPQDFGQLQSLTEIDFKGCGSLKELPDSFSMLSNLEKLNLSRCQKLWKLPPSVCGLNQLKVWKMSSTTLMHLPQDFGQLQSLISIDFEGCRSLEDLPDSFSELSNLEILNLHGCKKLQKLLPSICSLKQLRVWEMSYTALVHLPQDFGQLQSLSSIYFKGCGSLEELPDSFSELSNLETLDLSRCEKLWKLPPSICGLKQLRVWMMSYTVVVHLPQDFGQLRSLTKIDFEGCGSLEELPDSFSELSNLEILDLSRCQKLWKLPPSICGLKKLWVLQMSSTAMVHLPQDFGQLQSLRSIDFEGCGSLVELPDSFSKLSNLEILDLSRCQKLWKLPPSICGLKQLMVWKMSYTAVVQLPQDFGQLQRLRNIDFEGCGSLEELPDSFLELSNLQTLNFLGCLPPFVRSCMQLALV